MKNGTEYPGQISGNIAIGYKALYTLHGGAHNNIGIGHMAGAQVRTGYENICIGYKAGFSSTIADLHHTVSIGYTCAPDAFVGSYST